MGRGISPETKLIIDTSYEILSGHNPMTVRQVYYQLVSRQIIKNIDSRYRAVCKHLANARLKGVIPWVWIEDRLRKPRGVSMWNDLSDFGDTVIRSYRRKIWDKQPILIGVWLEKDALSGIFENVLRDYRITLHVGRGYDSWSSIKAASERYGYGDGVTILYFGDFDPSGEDMVRSLRERLGVLNCHPEIIKCALALDDIEHYQLPPDFAKKKDTRSKAFIEKNGDVSVELDALPANILETRLKIEIEKRMDLNALNAVKAIERSERQRLLEMFEQCKEAA